MDARFWRSQAFNYESYLDEVEKPLIAFAKLITEWSEQHSAKELGLREIHFILPVLTALVELPPQIRRDFYGEALDQLYQALTETINPLQPSPKRA